MIYEAIDRWNSFDSLAHYKYLKKLEIGGHTRYFYSLKDLQAYYDQLQNKQTKVDKKLYDENRKLAVYAINDNPKTSRHPSNLSGYGLGYELAGTFARTAHEIKSQKGNKKEALFATGKLAVSSLFGGSKESLQKKYKNSMDKAEAKHYKRVREIVNKGGERRRRIEYEYGINNDHIYRTRKNAKRHDFWAERG